MAAAPPIADSSIFSNPAALQQWSNLIDSMFGTSRNTTTDGTSTTSNSSAADAPLQALIQQLMLQLNQGANSPQMQALLGPIMAQLRDGALPGIQGLANAGGGVYNSTTQKLLQNDAIARATAQGGGLLTTQQNNLQGQLAQLLNILAKSNNQQNSANTSNQRQNTQGNAANAGKAALGGAAVGAAANALKKILGPQNNGPASQRYDITNDDEGNSFDTKADQRFNITGDDDGNSTDARDVGESVSGSDYWTRDDNAFGTNPEDSNDSWDILPDANYGDGNDGGGGGSESDFGWMDGIFDNDGDWGDFGGSFDFGGDDGGGFGDSNGDDYGESF